MSPRAIMTGKRITYDKHCKLEGTYVQTTPEEGKNESDEYVTIEDIIITSEMNASNREDENAEDGEKEIRTNERYNLRTRPKNTVQFALAQSDEQSIVLPKKTHTRHDDST